MSKVIVIDCEKFSKEFPIQMEYHHGYDLREKIAFEEEVPFFVFKKDCEIGLDGKLHVSQEKIVVDGGL